MEYLGIGFIIVISVVLLFFRVIEPGYIAIYNKPLYIHFYPFPKKLSDLQQNILQNEFVFYKNLTQKEKKYFEYRVADFISEYEFIGKESLVVTDQMKVLIAATSTMLTFGMKNYLYEVFKRIIIYPEEYYSTIDEEYHKGEYNPRMRTLVFSWKHFLEGYRIDNDNHNLGLHEFAHALNFQALKSNDTSMIIFKDMYTEILEYIHRSENAERFMQSDYFRIYAYTNRFEFIAVILEHFFETPQQFKLKFPELYHKVELMINHKSL